MKRSYVLCPICQQNIRSSRFATHCRRLHKGELSADALATILSGVQKPPAQGRAWIRARIRDKKEIKKVMAKFTERTPFSMRQWGEDRPKRTGPI